MTTVGIYSSNYYGGTVEEYPQAVERVMFTDRSHPIEPDDPRLRTRWWKPSRDRFWGRIAAAWWGYHPELAMPGVDVTIAIGNNFRIQVPDLAQRCLDALGDDDLLVMRHHQRDCIYDERDASRRHWRFTGSNQNLSRQVAVYRAAGHPRHWGLFHCGMLVRRDTPAMRAFNEAWFAEYRRWSSQNQLSLPPLLRKSDLKWHAFPDVGPWRAQPYEDGWVRWRDKVGHPREYSAIVPAIEETPTQRP